MADEQTGKGWPRTCCIYCGTRLTHRNHGREDSRLTCRRHRALLASDPMYAEPGETFK